MAWQERSSACCSVSSAAAAAAAAAARRRRSSGPCSAAARTSSASTPIRPQDGKIVEGLEAEDFEILEDGKPQKIESFDFVKFDTFTPDAVRARSAVAARGLRHGGGSALPRVRHLRRHGVQPVGGPFVPNYDLPRIQQPLVNFLDRVMGPRDLSGCSRRGTRSRISCSRRRATVTRRRSLDLWRASVIDRDEVGRAARPVSIRPRGLIEALKASHRADADLRHARRRWSSQLGSLRQERKNVVFVSNLLPRWRPDPAKLLDDAGRHVPKAGIRQRAASASATANVPAPANAVGLRRRSSSGSR